VKMLLSITIALVIGLIVGTLIGESNAYEHMIKERERYGHSSNIEQ
jgi:ABC-type nitrate/sulfonate/bicarbonate transport system permease component